MFEMWSLEEAEERRHSPGAQPLGMGTSDWDPKWIQIMGPAAGLALRCGADPLGPTLVRAVSHTREMGTQADQTQQQVVSLCTPVSWWIEGLREGWYTWVQEANGWDSDFMAQPLGRRLKGMS